MVDAKVKVQYQSLELNFITRTVTSDLLEQIVDNVFFFI